MKLNTIFFTIFYSVNSLIFAANSNFEEQNKHLKEYISSLEKKNLKPNLVFGVSCGEEGISRFDESWIFADIQHNEHSNRCLTINFNNVDEIAKLYSTFKDTFENIAFDAEVPTYIKSFTLEHLKSIHGILSINGSFYLPWQYCIDFIYAKNPPTTDLTFLNDQYDIKTIVWHTLSNAMVDPIIKMSTESQQNNKNVEEIINFIRDKNQLPFFEKIFGDNNVEILKERSLPFDSHEGRLLNPPYLNVFKAVKRFKTSDIVITNTIDDKILLEIKGTDYKLVDQINKLKTKKEYKNITSMVFVVNSQEKPQRFDKKWLQIGNNNDNFYDNNDYFILETAKSLNELKILSQEFNEAFDVIVFDVETPSILMSDWTTEHIKIIYNMLKNNGKLIIPINFAWSIYKTLLDGKKDLKIYEKNLKDKLYNNQKNNLIIDKDLYVPEIFYVETKETELKKQLAIANSIFAVYSCRSGKQLNEYAIKMIQKTSGGELTINGEIIKIINKNIDSFYFKEDDSFMKYDILSYLLKEERENFIKKITETFIIPHNISLLEEVFRQKNVSITDEDVLPFENLRTQFKNTVFVSTKQNF